MLDAEAGDCVTLARSPSCVELYLLQGERSLRTREQAIEAAARAASLSRVLVDRAEGGTALVYARGSFDATVTLWTGARSRRCLARPARDCADVIRVVRR